MTNRLTIPTPGRYYRLVAVPEDWRKRWPVGAVVRCTVEAAYSPKTWEYCANQGWRVRAVSAAVEAAARLSGAGEDSPI